MTEIQLKDLADNPKTFMSRGFWLHKGIGIKKERIEHWRAFAEDISVTLKEDGGIVGSGYKQSRIEKAVTNIVDLQQEILEDTENLIAAHKAIEYAIKVLLDDPAGQLVLEMRYLNYLPWAEIAFRLGWSYRHVQRTHKKSLQRFVQVILCPSGL